MSVEIIIRQYYTADDREKYDNSQENKNHGVEDKKNPKDDK